MFQPKQKQKCLVNQKTKNFVASTRTKTKSFVSTNAKMFCQIKTTKTQNVLLMHRNKKQKHFRALTPKRDKKQKQNQV